MCTAAPILLQYQCCLLGVGVSGTPGSTLLTINWLMPWAMARVMACVPFRADITAPNLATLARHPSLLAEAAATVISNACAMHAKAGPFRRGEPRPNAHANAPTQKPSANNKHVCNLRAEPAFQSSGIHAARAVLHTCKLCPETFPSLVCTYNGTHCAQANLVQATSAHASIVSR